MPNLTIVSALDRLTEILADAKKWLPMVDNGDRFFHGLDLELAH